ncbi:MAG: iron-containing alcohol dehydrogenase [Planctomycetaceae bacterium]|nr:iron-containing alcohol dehydrogenase [Planctomycetaceae bacterium]
MSPLDYSLLSPSKIRFGWGTRQECGELSKSLGRRARIVLGSRTLSKSPEYNEILDSFRDAGIEPHHLITISREPEVADVDSSVKALLEHVPLEGDFLVGIGGGAALDLAKAVAAMATNREGNSVKDFLEGVGRGLKITQPPLPMLAIPTTAGTGSEATKNAVISSYEPKFKKSLRSDLMVPDVVLIDPELSVSVPPETTAYSGMDAITQCLESYISSRSQPIPRAFALQGARYAIPSIVEAVNDPYSRSARERMAHAALLSGMALANSGLGMAHGVAAALGVHCKVPHGLACAVMLPVALRVNQSVAQRRLVELARECGHGDEETSDAQVADEFIARIERLCRAVKIPETLSALGVQRGQIPEIVASSRGNSMSGNPRELSDEELQEILEGML